MMLVARAKETGRTAEQAFAAPIPAVPLIVFAWGERRRTIARGDRALRVRDLYRGRRSLLWLLPAAALLAVPVAGAVDKAVGAARVLLPGHSLRSWGGDLFGFIPFGHFFSLPGSASSCQSPAERPVPRFSPTRRRALKLKAGMRFGPPTAWSRRGRSPPTTRTPKTLLS